MITRLLASPRRRCTALVVLAGLCPFAWWAVRPVGPDCLTLSSDPYGSTFDSSTMATTYHSTMTRGEDCAAGTTHPRLYDWLGL